MYSAIGKWCLGLPYEGVRELTGEEVAHLKLRISSFQRLSVICALVFGALFSILFIFLYKNAFFYNMPESFDATLAIFMLIGVLTPLVGAMSADYFIKARALKRDLSKGFIYQFSGIIGGSEEMGRAQQSLIKSGLITSQGNTAQQIEVLPASGAIFKANRTVPSRWIHAEIGEAVTLPKRAFILALPKEMLGVAIVGKLKLMRRRMSTEEMKELLEHIQNMRVPQVSFVLYAVFLTGILLVSYINQPTAEWLKGNPAFLGLCATLFFLMLFVYVTSILRARKLTKDSELGWVIIFPLDGKPAFKGCDPATTQAELLPISFGAWNVAGKPSLWRLIKSEAA
jgi:hypothetical protein